MLKTTWKVQYMNIKTGKRVNVAFDNPPTLEILESNIPEDTWVIVLIEPQIDVVEVKQDLRWVYGTRDEKWHLIGPWDRDYKSAITQEEMQEIGQEKAKIKYLGGHLI